MSQVRLMPGGDVRLDLGQVLLRGLDLASGIAAGLGRGSSWDAFDLINIVAGTLNSCLVVAHRVHIARGPPDRAASGDPGQVLLGGLLIVRIGCSVGVAAALQLRDGFGDVGRPATVTGELLGQPLTAAWPVAGLGVFGGISGHRLVDHGLRDLGADPLDLALHRFR